MPDLSTTYMGLTLKNPIIVGSSGLTSSVKGAREAEAAGAGASEDRLAETLEDH